MKILLAALTLLLLSTISVDAADKCLSRSEARAIYPKDYLYWRPTAGKRCWSNRRPVAIPRTSRAQVVPPRPAPPQPPQIILLPEGLMPPHSLPVERPFVWEGWEAQAQGRGAIPELPAAERGPVYSTFKDDPPDVWPPLGQQLCPICIATWIAVLLGIAALAFAFWQLLAGVAPHKLTSNFPGDAQR